MLFMQNLPLPASLRDDSEVVIGRRNGTNAGVLGEVEASQVAGGVGVVNGEDYKQHTSSRRCESSGMRGGIHNGCNIAQAKHPHGFDRCLRIAS